MWLRVVGVLGGLMIGCGVLGGWVRREWGGGVREWREIGVKKKKIERNVMILVVCCDWYFVRSGKLGVIVGVGEMV